MKEDWKPVTQYLENKDIANELRHIAHVVMDGGRLPNRDPYLIDVCLLAEREIYRLRAALASMVAVTIATKE
jgi:hypothetical protein